MPELPRTSSWLRWRTSWHASHGPYYQAEKTIDRPQASPQHELAGPVIAPHQPISSLPTEVCTGTAKTKEQSQRRAHNLSKRMVSNDRSVYKEGHARNSSWPGELISTQRPHTFAQTCLLVRNFSLAVVRRTIHSFGVSTVCGTCLPGGCAVATHSQGD